MDSKCDKENKIPISEREFLYYQQNGRLKYIGTLDRVETNNIAKRNKQYKVKRKTRLLNLILKLAKRIFLKILPKIANLRVMEQNDRFSSTSQMRIELPATA